MSDTTIFCPDYFQIVRYDGEAWYFKHSQRFYNPQRIKIPSFINLSQIDKLAAFGTTTSKLIKEFCLINGGQIGYYLADLNDQKYYYCGLNWKDIKHTLRSLRLWKGRSNGELILHLRSSQRFAR